VGDGGVEVSDGDGLVGGGLGDLFDQTATVELGLVG